jgi:hypothetical protein
MLRTQSIIHLAVLLMLAATCAAHSTPLPPAVPSWPCTPVATLTLPHPDSYAQAVLAAQLDGRAGDELVTVTNAYDADVALRHSLQRRGIANPNPYGDNSLRFRATNHCSVPVTVRFSGIQQPRYSPGHLDAVSVQPLSIRQSPNSGRSILVHVASKSEASGTAIFRFMASTEHRDRR